MEKYDVVIVGGGFFGCSLALHIQAQHKKKVLVLEKEPDIMTRASYHNQARVHGGYHYSRSLLTALRSQMNFKNFVAEYGTCIDSSFEKYYAIGRHLSKVSSSHFRQFCERIGAPINHAPDRIKKLFDPTFTEEVFTVREYAFDSMELRKLTKRRMHRMGIEYRLEREAVSLRQLKNGMSLRVKDLKTAKTTIVHAKEVFNCTYTQINKLNAGSKLPLIPFKHELTEMALVEVPDELKNVGITIMDGPFFSVMPFPSRGLHTLSHVRYTPHVAWQDSDAAKAWRDGHKYLKQHKPASAFKKMLADSIRYVPILSKAIHKDSLWEVKTILPKSEDDDSRPILYLPDYGGAKGYNCIMGGKIDNIQEILKEVDLAYAKAT